MVRIAVDAGQAQQHSSNITASHQEIPSAGARVNVRGTSGTLGGDFYSKFQSHVEQLSSQVGQLQESVAQTVSTYDKAASSQVEHDAAVKSAITKITSVVDAGRNAAPTTPTSKTGPV